MNVVNEVQLQKAALSIVFTLTGMVMLFNPLLENAESPMYVTFEGIVIDVKLSQP